MSLKTQGIGQLFVQEKLMEQAQAFQFYTMAAAEKISLVQFLVKNNILSASQIAHTIATSFGLPLLDITCIHNDSIPATLISERLIRQHGMLPLFHRGTNLYLATEDPSNQAALKEIHFHTNLNIHVIVVEADKLSLLINQILKIKENESLTKGTIDEWGFEDCISYNEDDAPIVRFVNKILLDAIKQGSSDIHIEPFEKAYQIRYRQDGILHEVDTPPLSISAQVTARIKIMANLDSSERRLPQDGGFKRKIANGVAIDFRVSTCPTAHGEKVVIRILNPGTTQLGIEHLGLDSLQKELFLRAINRAQGMILVTGPTGSGKTVSLYTALNILNTKKVNILTVEDPIEIKIEGLNQVPINTKAGLTFAVALRAFLRQDPDIIMVGEMRDCDTAEIAMQAAQTGHLVLSTLHTNSAAETLNRLLDMGIPAFNVANAVSLIIAQRLARKLCVYCKELRTDVAKANLLDLGFLAGELEEIKLYKAGSCSKCVNGYRGRIGLFEVLTMTHSLGKLIMSGGNSLDILKKAQEEGMITLYQSGIAKVKEGITTIEEINRVTID